MKVRSAAGNMKLCKCTIKCWNSSSAFAIYHELMFYILVVGEKLVVATTRVETMLGDTAIAVHPDDQRYKVRKIYYNTVQV